MTRRILTAFIVLVALAPTLRAQNVKFPFQEGDRVAWIGSSSTNFNIWPKTMEFLLHTRHPELKLTFKKFSTGGGTFKTGADNADKWLGDFKPTLVFFNYGANDADSGGEAGLDALKRNMEKIVDKVAATKARYVFLTPQAADPRKSKVEPARRRALYAEEMLKFTKEKGWPAVDIHRPLDDLQKAGQKENDAYSILKDNIHLTTPAYIAWGYYLYARIGAPVRESLAELSADGKIVAKIGCDIDDVKADQTGLAFTRRDAVLPLLPPGELPPSKYVPLADYSRYSLKITGFPEGKYRIAWEGKDFAHTDAKILASGVNLNALILESKSASPWEAQTKAWWEGRELDKIGHTSWRFEVRAEK